MFRFLVRLFPQIWLSNKLLKNALKARNSKNKLVSDVISFSRLLSIMIPITFIHDYLDFKNHRLTRKEKELITLIAALISPYDSLIDDMKISPNRLDLMFKKTSDFVPKTTLETITLELFKEIKDRIPDETYSSFNAVLQKLHNTQQKSRFQKDENISLEELQSITRKKGGYTMVILIHHLKPSMKKAEFNSLFELGAYIQYMDDWVDMQDDIQAGIHTLFTHPKHKTKAKKLMREQKQKTYRTILKWEYPEISRKKLLYKYHLVLTILYTLLRIKEQKMIIQKFYGFRLRNMIPSLLFSLKYSLREIYTFNFDNPEDNLE
ncbi:hypothetical protein GF362_04775 [Candidatus Dojkabacteria bacterium]|nr:hypothetical protein [Candidatus Dojkabacteria bacterium]